eukprot:SAG31_NODE_151_length_22216_cov_37.572139_17_plen_105_part_00
MAAPSVAENEIVRALSRVLLLRSGSFADQSGLNQYDMPAIADSLTQSGLRAAGYGFVNSDAGWQPPLGARAPYLGRNSTGSPTGYLDMAALGTTLHAKGFLYGL